MPACCPCGPANAGDLHLAVMGGGVSLIWCRDSRFVEGVLPFSLKLRYFRFLPLLTSIPLLSQLHIATAPRVLVALQVSLHIMIGYFWLISLVIGSMFMWSVAALDFHLSFKVEEIVFLPLSIACLSQLPSKAPDTLCFMASCRSCHFVLCRVMPHQHGHFGVTGIIHFPPSRLGLSVRQKAFQHSHS